MRHTSLYCFHLRAASLSLSPASSPSLRVHLPPYSSSIALTMFIHPHAYSILCTRICLPTRILLCFTHLLDKRGDTSDCTASRSFHILELCCKGRITQGVPCDHPRSVVTGFLSKNRGPVYTVYTSTYTVHDYPRVSGKANKNFAGGDLVGVCPPPESSKNCSEWLA